LSQATEDIPAGWQAELGRAAGAGIGSPPEWLAQVVVALLDGQPPATGRTWLNRIRTELARLEGRVPFAVVYDWHASTVLPLLGDAGLEDARVSLAPLHAEALAGRPADPVEWAAVIEPVLRDIYHRGYGYTEAYAVNYANAHEYGTANGFGEEGTAEYATYYAELATGANLRAYADANAIANARATAEAFAAADPVAYAQSYPYAAARAYALALAGAGAHQPAPAAAGLDQPEPAAAGLDQPAPALDQPEPADRQSAAYARLAGGLADSLGRATMG
jgi:hypothetical protein